MLLASSSFLIKAFTPVSGTKKNIVKRTRRIVIVGTEEEYAEVKTLLPKAGSEERIISHMAAEQLINNSLKTTSALNLLETKDNTTEIIFCHGKTSYSWIIRQLENLPPAIAVRFHSAGTESIVGSDSKNSMGTYLSVK